MHKGAANGKSSLHPNRRAAPLLGLVILCHWASALAEPFQNLTIEQALDRLEADGLSILYSSDLIRPWMRVREEPESTVPQGVLKQILAPYRLTVADGPDGTLMIVREVTGSSSWIGALEGHHELVAGETLAVEVHSQVDDGLDEPVVVVRAVAPAVDG